MFAHCLIIFPFPGLARDSDGYRLFIELLDLCNNFECGPIVIYDQRSREPQDTKAILEDLRASGRAEVVAAWGVDTCQDWLTGWGYVLDHRVKPRPPEEEHRIILLPGDLEQVHEKDRLFRQLREFIQYDKCPFLLGDFDSFNPFGAKELIDRYGTYPLIANWFPDAWQAIQSLSVRKPRSEFTNIAAPELRRLLKSRVFAYEQTLTMLIVNWYWCWSEARKNLHRAKQLWDEHVASMHLGSIEDDSSTRHFRGAIDQIERTERMLRMMWRELNDWNPNQSPDEFRTLVESYERLDERSTRIRVAAQISIWAQLQQSTVPKHL